MAEPKKGVNKGNAGKGRPKGSLNKTTTIAKNAIAKVADNIGGAERMTAWVKEDPDNERIFWQTIYPKLLPLQVGGEGVNGEIIFKNVIHSRGD